MNGAQIMSLSVEGMNVFIAATVFFTGILI